MLRLTQVTVRWEAGRIAERTRSPKQPRAASRFCPVGRYTEEHVKRACLGAGRPLRATPQER